MGGVGYVGLGAYTYTSRHTNRHTQPDTHPNTRTHRPIRKEAEYGTLPWAVAQILRLAAPRVLVHAETKKLFLQVLILLVSGPAARNLDPAITLEMLRLLRTW